MKTVVLDGYAANPGDLSWDFLSEFGEYKVYDRTPADKVVERVKGYDAVLTNKTVFRRETLEQLPEVKYIGVLATGYDVVDWQYCKEKNIPVVNIPAYSTYAVAQFVFAHILNYTNQVALHSESVHRGEWAENPDYSYRVAPIFELKDKTLGIIGLGKIGKTVADIGTAFGMKVIANTNHPAPYGSVEFVSIDEIKTKSDFIAITAPLNDNTRGLVNKDFLASMKPTAMVINTSRGPIIDEDALADALKNGTIAAAGIDVMCKEPPEKGNALFEIPNCSITPHIAWAGYETRTRLLGICRENLRAYANGKPINVVY